MGLGANRVRTLDIAAEDIELPSRTALSEGAAGPGAGSASGAEPVASPGGLCYPAPTDKPPILQAFSAETRPP